MRTTMVAFIFVLVSALSVSAEPGLINLKSSHDVKNTADRLETVLKEKGMNVFNIDLPRTTRAQVGQGQPVPFGKLRAGDLVFFKPPSYPRHVGIYLGGSEFVHASKNKGVTVSKIDRYYWGKYYWTARRILPASDHY